MEFFKNLMARLAKWNSWQITTFLVIISLLVGIIIAPTVQNSENTPEPVQEVNKR